MRGEKNRRRQGEGNVHTHTAETSAAGVHKRGEELPWGFQEGSLASITNPCEASGAVPVSSRR